MILMPVDWKTLQEKRQEMQHHMIAFTIIIFIVVWKIYVVMWIIIVAQVVWYSQLSQNYLSVLYSTQQCNFLFRLKFTAWGAIDCEKVMWSPISQEKVIMINLFWQCNGFE